MRNGTYVVDADAHQMEPPDFFLEWIDPSFLDRAPRLQKLESGRRYVVEGKPFTYEHGTYPMAAPEFLEAAQKARDRFAGAAKTGFSPARRVEDMDSEGVDVQIIYPSAAGQMLGREFDDPELLAACCRAYNDWSRAYCADHADRLRWAAILPIQDVALAVKEAERAAALGAVSFYVRPQPVKDRLLPHEDYWPLWETIERLDRPISVHDSASCYLPSFGDRFVTHTSGHIVSHPFEAMATMMTFIWHGMFERFPKLTLVHVECDAGWLPFWLQRMEQHYDFSGTAEHPDLKRRPTDYFKSNIFVAARADEPMLKSVVELAGDDNLLWNSDYPHPDGTWPWALGDFDRQQLTEESRRKLLWENPRRAFRIAEAPAASAHVTTAAAA